ncbi:MAG TPA: hypothetical protein VL523_17490, partial [Terriglobia bacterium]|nr:hypothetical protein [Terriglobia bacterium]
MAQLSTMSFELPEMLRRANEIAGQWLKIDYGEMPGLPEWIDVYQFFQGEFERGPVTENRVFQFVYRSFYRMDNAG